MPSLPPRIGQRTPVSAPPTQLSAAKRGYGRKWRRFRLVYLRENPLCADCEQRQRYVPASEIHHMRKVVERPDLMFTCANLMPLCAACHGIRTARGE